MNSEAETSAPEETSDELQPPRDGLLTRMTPVTTPGCASCLTTLFLVFTVIAAILIFLSDPNHVPWQHTVGWPRIAVVLILLVAIPMVVHRLVRLWLEGEQSRFPDLEYAWNAGLHALASNGLSIRSIPIYLVVGTKSERQERAIFGASRTGMRVEGVPEGPAPIHWYANPDGIYICCSDASWTSALASLREELLLDAAGRGLGDRESVSVQRMGSQRPVPPPVTSTSPSPTSSGEIGGTMMLDEFVVPDAESPSRTANLASADTDRDLEPTMASAVEEEMEDLGRELSIEPVIVSSQYSSATLQELQQLGRLLRQVREPVCGLNGVVLLIQLEAIHGSTEEMDELKKAMRADLETIHHASQVRCPVTTLVVGLEQERGFRELIRRVGKERAEVQRFGKKFDVEVIPEATLMAPLSAHVCGAFEDWCYTLFREEKSLAHTGNTRLYELLAKVRLGWKSRLGELLARTIGCDASPEGKQNAYLYSGCYVAATGDTADRQGFVKGVLDKLNDEQEFVEWTPEAIREDARRRWLIRVGLVACFVAIGSLITMMVLSRM